METYAFIVIGILVMIGCKLLWWGTVCIYHDLSCVNRRARELLLAVLTPEQYRLLILQGYIDDAWF